MEKNSSGNKTWRRRLLLAGVLLVAIAAGIYWYLATETFSDTADRKPDYVVEAGAFLKEFMDNPGQANQKYADRIIAVNGRVTQTEPVDTVINVKMVDAESGSYIIFAFQDQHLEEARKIRAGDSLSIKGSCSGSIYSDILEVHQVSFKRSAINN